jgi:TPR repeat protein
VEALTNLPLVLVSVYSPTMATPAERGSIPHAPPTRVRPIRIIAGLFLSLLLASAPIPSSGAPATDKAVRAMGRGDFKTALYELRPLAAKHDPNAQFLLGMLYDAGKGVPQDQSIAASWYRKAAEQNHLLGRLYLGILYYSGQGVKQNYAEAARWLRAPAESGNDEAQFYLGSLYSRGTGVKKDPAEAIRWLTRAAAQRNTRAMGLLATELFSRSHGAQDQDLVDAYAWSHLAAELDPVQATTSARYVIEKYCSEDQKEKGKAAIAEWKRRWSKEAKAPASKR